ncbi:MAG: protein-export membrane protein SecF [Nitrospirae bacterium GWA2_42_11]|nr:MAG: protein-export membrane protein SecF [Nitrospirae bacterium GWA2_42_11]OGW56153.1 MAG: protein-export membrane protein SecF [Nitrospirae bacterium RIFCSPHIGHO2_02_FULL_42_12]HAS16815.1 protein translocase subunit SecF [Nitrospiraceae bacterium]
MEILGDTNVDFMGLKKYAFVFSGILSLLGIIAVIGMFLGYANIGIDFGGGTAVQVKFDKPVRIDTAREALSKNGIEDAELQEFPMDNKLLVRLKNVIAADEHAADKVISIFRQEFPDNNLVVDTSMEIGPTVGKKLQKNAITAVVLSMIGIIIYIAFRFELRFGIAAAIATFHDVLAVMGIFFILGKEMNLLIVTALLTLAGYSLTDTVVVFDRIREYLRLRRKDPIEVIINNGINHVLSRTIITSLTTALVLVALVIFGGEVIHDFSLALLIGVGIGTYSSIFVASPLLLLSKGKKKKS